MVVDGDAFLGNYSADDFMFGNFSNMSFSGDFISPFSVLFYRYMFIVIYSLILVVCIIGNILVLIVTTKSPRMKTRTNFFLANLAAADLCVGVLCILPNLLTFLYPGWLLGTVMCKLYYFSESFGFCASVLLLAVIALERYIAVMHPLKAKGLFTKFRMHCAQALIWIFAALYNIPLLIIYDTLTTESGPDETTTFCFLLLNIINMRIYYTINFVLWYVMPLVTMSVVYAIISWTLWHSGTLFNRQNADTTSNGSSTKMTPMVRQERTSGNMSSSSSSADGRSGRNSSSGGSQILSRHDSCKSNINVCDGGYGNCGCGACTDASDRFLVNGTDSYGRYSDAPNQNVAKPNGGPVQPTVHTNSDGLPIYWSWQSGSEIGRCDNPRQPRRSSHYIHRCNINHNVCSTYEMTCMNQTCLQYPRTHPKRQSIVMNHAVSLFSKRRSARRSFQSDYASDVSNSGATTTYDSNRRNPTTSMRVLTSRRKVVRLLVTVLLTFALCVLPHHLRLLMHHWEVYPRSSFGMGFFPPLAFICMYLNSALNPVLYSLFSESFRRSLRECLRRPCQRWKKIVFGCEFLPFRKGASLK